MHSLSMAVLCVLLLARTAGAAFPDGFLWGTATAAFQTEMGGKVSSNDPGSDWWAWVHDPMNITDGKVSGDQPEDGPASWDNFRTQVRRNAADQLGTNAFRLSIEWSRIFPTSTASVDASGGITLDVLRQLDQLADRRAVRHYQHVLHRVRASRMVPFVTANHFTLPLWIHDPIAARDVWTVGPPPAGLTKSGWIDAATVGEFRKYTAYLAWKFGRQVDYWAPINEPLSVATGGYANIPGAFAQNFPPGVLSFVGLIRVILNMIDAQGVAYDAIKQWDTRDADRDGTNASVGAVLNMINFVPTTPGNTNDETGAQHANYLYNRLFANGVFLGDVDANANGAADPGEHRPDLVGRADFLGLNYYFRARTTGLGSPVTPVIPLFDFLPTFAYATPENPSGPACPTQCSEFGWEIYPPGLRAVLEIAGSYGRPVYITENGIADADDDQRPAYLVQHLQVLEQAIVDEVADIRGYFHWSLVDNFEWATGYFTKFGLFSFDATGTLTPRASADHYRRIIEANAIPADLAMLYGAP